MSLKQIKQYPTIRAANAWLRANERYETEIHFTDVNYRFSVFIVYWEPEKE